MRVRRGQERGSQIRMQKACQSQLSADPSCSDPVAVTHQTVLCAACRAPTNAQVAQEGGC